MKQQNIGLLYRLALPAVLSLGLSACVVDNNGSSSSSQNSSSSSSVSSSQPPSSSSSVSSSSSSSSGRPLPGQGSNDPSYGGSGLAGGVPFPLGIAVPDGTGTSGVDILSNGGRQNVVKADFSQITLENKMKMNYSLQGADSYVNWARQNNLGVHGHALVWHPSYQLPNWVNSSSGEQFKQNYRDHVRNVANHFKGRVTSWDVVNEALHDGGGSGQNGYRDSPFYQKWGGPGYIEEAFRVAREADPDAILYYNDYNTEENLAKTDKLVEMVTDFVERGVPIDGVGFQMHVLPDWATVDMIRESFVKVVNISDDLLIKITELDVRISNKYADPPQIVSCNSGCSEALNNQKLRYQEVIEVYLEVVPPHQRGGITIWGIADNDSWFYSEDHNGQSYNDYPLLFDSNLNKKPAYEGVKEALSNVD